MYSAQKKNYCKFGLGLRPKHYQTILNNKPHIDWFEIISEDFLVEGGPPIYHLEKIAEQYPMAMHGVSLSIGSTDPLNRPYLKKLKALADKLNPLWVSDHFCWTGVKGVNTHDLLPMPFTEEAVKHVVKRARIVQDFLERPLLLENVSSYVNFKDSTMTEWEFIVAVAKEAKCLLLLDVNNVYVNAMNHGFDPITFLNAIPNALVQQYHIAGHLKLAHHILDTHDHKIIPAVWKLYAHAVKIFSGVATLIERDSNIPELPDLLKELEYARSIK